MTLAPAHIDRGHDPAQVRDELIYAITSAIGNHPRSQQVAIGPSEIGSSCTRRIGYKLLGLPEINDDPMMAWKPTVGTAVHAWLEAALQAENADIGTERYLTEQTVMVGFLGGRPVFGHGDVYDVTTAGVVDWKTAGPTELRNYRINGPGPQYRAQAHLYGRGFVMMSRPVEWVGIMFLPRNGELSEAWFWHEPYQEQIALDALQRAEGIHLATQALGTAALEVLPTFDAYCHRCPWFRPGSTDLAAGCPGDPNRAIRATKPALTLSR